MPPTFQTSPFKLTANEPKDLGWYARSLRIVTALGNLTIRTQENEFEAVQGDVFTLPDSVKFFSIKSDQDETIKITYGTGLILVQPSGSGGGVATNVNATIVAPIPLPVTGTVNNVPASPDLMVFPATGALVQETSTDGTALDVNSVAYRPAQVYVANAFQILPCSTSGMIHIIVVGGAIGDKMSVAWMGQPLPVYDRFGRYYSQGIIQFDGNNPSGTGFYIDVRDAVGLEVNSIVGGVQFIAAFGPAWALPTPSPETIIPWGITGAMNPGGSFSQSIAYAVMRGISGSTNPKSVTLRQTITVQIGGATANVIAAAYLSDGTLLPFRKYGQLLATGTYTLEAVWQKGRMDLSIVNAATGAIAVTASYIDGLLPAFDIALGIQNDAGSADQLAVVNGDLILGYE